LGCPSSKDTVVMLPQTIKAGDTLKWKGIDPKIGTLTLTIPDGLCEQSAALGTPYPKYHVYVVEVGPQGGECTVKSQLPSSSPIPWYYKYDFEPAQGAGSIPSSSKVVQPAVEVLDIVGSCDGCGAGGKPGIRHARYGALQEQVECEEDTPNSFSPHVVDGGGNDVVITVPSTVSTVKWQKQGPGELTLTFDPAETPPCTPLTGATCTVNDKARPTKGSQPQSYFYTVSLSTCNNNTPSPGKFTFVTPPPP
jgi:hypothetical protein